MKERLRALATDLMLLPGLSGYEGRVRASLRDALAGLGITSQTDRLGNLTATMDGLAEAPSVMLMAPPHNSVRRPIRCASGAALKPAAIMPPAKALRCRPPSA